MNNMFIRSLIENMIKHFPDMLLGDIFPDMIHSQRIAKFGMLVEDQECDFVDCYNSPVFVLDSKDGEWFYKILNESGLRYVTFRSEHIMKMLGDDKI